MCYIVPKYISTIITYSPCIVARRIPYYSVVFFAFEIKGIGRAMRYHWYSKRIYFEICLVRDEYIVEDCYLFLGQFAYHTVEYEIVFDNYV